RDAAQRRAALRFHTFGCVISALGSSTHGGCLVLPSETFDPLAVLEAVEAERCTALCGVPTMFIMQLDHPRFEQFDLTSLRTGMMGGAPCPGEVMKRVQSQMHMRDVTIVCGMTETSPASTQTATLRLAPPFHAAPRANNARAATASCSATGTILMPLARRSMPLDGCTPATWPQWTSTATSASSDD